MNEALKTTLSLSCSGGLLIIILYLLRPWFRSRLSKRWQYYIWLVAVVRLLLPFAPEVNLMGTLFQQIDEGIAQIEVIPFLEQDISAAPEASLPGGDGVAAEEEDLEDEQSGIAKGHILWMGWLMMALILFIRKVTIYQSFVKYIKAGCSEVTDIDLLEQFGRMVGQSGIKTTVELYRNDLISSPLLIGFFRPCIVLSGDELSDSEFRYTILHEFTHYRRRDMFYKWLIQVAVCVHWFNPLVCLMSHEVERLCELSCDEVIVKDLTMQERRAYGDTLLNAAGRGGSYKSAVASVTLSESKEQLKERLNAIANFQGNSKGIFHTFALTAAICFGAAAIGAYTAVPLPASGETPSAKPHTVGNLTLEEKEYTVKQLETLDISSIMVNTLSDDVSVVRGGDTLKFEYYAQSQDEYTIKWSKLEGAQNKQNGNCLYLSRHSSSNVGKGRSITVTIPEKLRLEELRVITTSGDISLMDCSAATLETSTQNGEIKIRGGSVSELFFINTKIGNVLISEVILPEGSGSSSPHSTFNTESGAIVFQPRDSKENYCFIVDYGEEAEIVINGEGIEKGRLADIADEHSSLDVIPSEGGAPGETCEFIRENKFMINESAEAKIYFKSLRGSLIVQEK